MSITIIAALAPNRAIGKGDRMPWRIPEEFAHFKKATMGGTLVMGRKTFASIGRPLPGRRTVVVSRSLPAETPGVDVCRTLDEALAKAASYGAEVFVCGGAEIYRQCLPIADRLCLSYIKKSYDGDVFFPEFDPGEWGITVKGGYAEFVVVVYERRQRHRFAYEEAGHRVAIYNMDCISGIKKALDRGSVDVVVTSPPYNLGTPYKKYDDTISRQEYLEWTDAWARAVSGVLRDKGSLFLNVGSKPSDPWVPFEVLFEMRKHFHLQNVIHWIKSIAIQKEDVGDYPGIDRNVSVGHYKPINSLRYINDCHEYIFHLTKNGDVELDRLAIGVEYQDKSNVTRWEGVKGDRRCRGNTWFVPYKTIKSRNDQRPHPATFPVKIPQMCIALHGLNRTRLVVDPFLGIGHTALACMELGIDFVGFEIDPEYFTESRKAILSFRKSNNAKFYNKDMSQLSLIGI